MKNLKIAMKYWLECPSCCLMMALELVFRCAYVGIHSYIWRILPQVFDSSGDYWKPVIVVLSCCAFNIFASASIGLLRTSKTQIGAHMARRFIRKVLDADYDLFTKYSCSYVRSVREQAWEIGAASRLVSDLLVCAFNIVITMYNVWKLCQVLVLPIAIIYCIMSLVIIILVKMFAKIEEERDTTGKAAAQEVHEVVNGFAEVRCFCTEEYHYKSISDRDKMITKILFKKAEINASINAVMDFVQLIATGVAILFLLKELRSGRITPAEAVATVSLTIGASQPLIALIAIADEMTARLAGIGKFEEILQFKNTVKTGNINISSFKNEVVLNDISFQYNDSEEILRNVNITIPKGSKIGICGKSGGGKSTMFKLLAKYYDPTKGNIEIDGFDYNDLDVHSLRKIIGVVHQDNHIFNGTIYENVIYGNWNCTEYDVIEACKKANLYDFIQGLQDKFNTEVGDNGLKLSGGQKQRIAIARVFLSNADIILLDEATSALDNESDMLVQEALKNFEGKTIIAIAHRLSTIKDSDCIYVVGNNTIMESGTHEELLTKNGEYAHLCKQADAMEKGCH